MGTIEIINIPILQVRKLRPNDGLGHLGSKCQSLSLSEVVWLQSFYFKILFLLFIGNIGTENMYKTNL